MSTHKRQPTTRGLAEAWIRERRNLGTITPRTAVNVRCILHAFADIAPRHAADIHRRNVVAYMGSIRHLTPNVRRNYYSTVRLFCGWLQRRKYLPRDPFIDVPKPSATRPMHRALDHGQVLALIGACVDPRDIVIVLLGVHVGLRRAEMAALEVGDIALAGRTVTVRRGKGGHPRIVPLPDEAAAVLAHYLASQAMTGGPLIRPMHGHGEGVTAGTVGKIIRDIAVRAGVKVRGGDGIGTHSLRHTAATDIYLACRDVLAVRDVLGHVNLNTTEKYVRGLDLDRLRVAVEGRRYAA